MEVTLYLPYYDYNDEGFDVNEDFYKDGDEYVKAVSDEYDKNKDIVFNSMMDAKNGSGSLLRSTDDKTYVFSTKTSQSEEKVVYTSSKSTLYNDEGKEETVDKLITHYVDGKPFIEMIEFDDSTSEDEFISEVSLWVREHNSINKYRDFKGEEWTLRNEPLRNLRVHFINKANEDIYAVLDNCKILDIVDEKTMIIYINKIRLIDKIEDNG